MDDVHELLAAALSDPETGWSLGTFGAAGEFRRRPDEPVRTSGAGGLGLRTRRGGIRIAARPDLVPVAYETPVPGGWSHAVALCLPAASARGAARGVATELGPDRDALDPAHAGRILFDLGFGLPHLDICARSDDPAALARLRAGLGTGAREFGPPVLADLEAGRLGLVLTGALGRVEVDAAGPPPGPRAYAVAQVLRLRRSHAATAPIPPGLVPCAHLHPAHPERDATGAPLPFCRRRHAAFQALLARWGDPDLLAAKRHRLGLGPRPGRAPDRWTRAAERVADAQAARLNHCSVASGGVPEGEVPARPVIDS